MQKIMQPSPYTVTNSYKGGLFMRTYARNVRRAWDGGDLFSPVYAPPSKRLCTTDARNPNPTITFRLASENYEDTLERAIRETSVAISSSPSRKNSTIFSLAESQDDHYYASETMTPPSSPPPQEQLRITPPAIKARKPTFACLNKDKKRKRTASASRNGSETPLSEVVNSSIGGRVSSATTSSDPPPAKKQQTLVQMRLDLGQSDVRKSCAECGMEWVPSNEEDATLHKMYHNMDRDGVELGKTFMKSAMKWRYEMPHIQGCVVIVDRKVSMPARKMVQKVLGIVNKELGAAEIDDVQLWSQKSLSEDAPAGSQEVKQSESEKRNNNKSDRYKVFLHVKDGKCVGACLAERITKAHRVKLSLRLQESGEGNNMVLEGNSSSIEVDEESVPAAVGVSRIWTSKAFRRKGIAQNLLDCVLGHFVFGMDIEKDELAFSQPTESGAALARKWYDEDSGWLVYNED